MHNPDHHEELAKLRPREVLAATIAGAILMLLSFLIFGLWAAVGTGMVVGLVGLLVAIVTSRQNDPWRE